MKDKSKIILIIAILAIIALIAYVCYGIFKGPKNPVATMEVSYIDSEGNEKTGTVKIELNPDVAPESVANFIQLSNNGFYDGLTFHRMISDFMVQGGDKQGDGSGSAKMSDLDKKIQADSDEDYTYSIEGEFYANGINNSLKFEKGVIGMARSDYSSYGLAQEGYNSASSQFFIVTTDDQNTLNSLNQYYASFGKVIEGYEIIEEMSNIYASESDSVEKLNLSYTSEDGSDENTSNVTVTVNKELDSQKIPEGWTLSEDSLTITKQMQKGESETLTLTSTDGDTVVYPITAGENGNNTPIIKTVRVDTFGANYGMPNTINYDEILSTVQTYQNYYNQFMNSSDTTTEDTSVEE